MKNTKIKFLTQAAIVAALYVALTLISKPFTIGFVEIRISEALCILPYFLPGSVWGLFAGCFIANLFSGSILDIVVGSLATLIGAYLTSKIKNKWLCPLPAVLSNTILIPFVIMNYSGVWQFSAYLAAAGGVLASEIASVYILGMILLIALEKKNIFKH
ncbi:MAG: QueT transporter family protein [Clostridia bacterium]|nr:QueT transporter family protein [Clostridia bacterium]